MEHAMPPAGTTFAIAAPTVFDGKQWLQDHCVIVSEAAVAQVLPSADCPSSLPIQVLREGTLAPGFIDLQVNGGGGIMLNNDPRPASVDTISLGHRSATPDSLPGAFAPGPARRTGLIGPCGLWPAVSRRR